jgi:hypothetical protein
MPKECVEDKVHKMPEDRAGLDERDFVGETGRTKPWRAEAILSSASPCRGE